MQVRGLRLWLSLLPSLCVAYFFYFEGKYYIIQKKGQLQNILPVKSNDNSDSFAYRDTLNIC